MSTEDLNEWNVVVGEVIAAHGIRGELQVRSLTDQPQRFETGSRLCLVDPEEERRLVEVLRARAHKGGLILEITMCETRNEAERLRGGTLTIHPSMRAPLPEGRYYHDDLIGVRVVTVDGEFVGTIREVLETGSNDVFVTERAMIPATREIVRSVDVARKEMIVQPVPGLLDPDES